MKLITIAIPTYNNESTIKRTIDSCTNQIDLDDVEILVINNASKDKTAEILLSYGKEIRVVTNYENVSLFENHNVAFKNSKSEYVLFCHSDDILTQDATKILKKKINERGRPRKYIAWGHSLFRDFYPSVINSNFSTGQVFAGIYATNPFLEGGLTPSGTCYSRDFIEIGGFLPVQHKLAPSDATSMINAVLNGFKFEMIQDIIFCRTSASTLTCATKNHERIAGYENAFHNLFDLIEESNLKNIISSTYAMRSLPLEFLRVASLSDPRMVLNRMINAGKKKPSNLLNPLFVRTILFTLHILINERKK